MADDAPVYLAEWWPPDPADGITDAGERIVVEVRRTEEGELALYLRGLSGNDDAGTIYLHVDVAAELGPVMHAEARRKWDGVQ